MKAGRKGDEPLVVLSEELFIDPGLVVKALGEGGGYQLAQVVVADQVFGQEDQVEGGLGWAFGRLVGSAPGAT